MIVTPRLPADESPSSTRHQLWLLSHVLCCRGAEPLPNQCSKRTHRGGPVFINVCNLPDGSFQVQAFDRQNCESPALNVTAKCVDRHVRNADTGGNESADTFWTSQLHCVFKRTSKPGQQ